MTTTCVCDDMPPAILPRSPPPLMEELVEEILLRLPPDEPAHLFRAAAVCKAWRTMLSDSSGVGFLRRYRKFHGTPPMLGYLRNTRYHPEFVATTSAASPPSLSSAMPMPVDDCNVFWEVLDCRHGRVLMHHAYGTSSSFAFIIWDPITRARNHVVVHGHNQNLLAAAVICDIDGCDHLDCHGGPFRLVLVEKRHNVNGEDIARASVYSSETDAWTVTSASIVLSHFESVHRWCPSLLIGDVLYFTLNGGVWRSIVHLKYDLGSHGLSIIDTSGVCCDAVAIKAEDGGLGFVDASEDNCIYLWSSKQANGTTGGDGRWARHKAMDLNKLALFPTSRASLFDSRVIGYIEGTNTIFFSIHYTGVFKLDLKSSLVRKVNAKRFARYCIVPYTSFYTPGYLLDIQDFELAS
ncbi:hypothetical protein U9M48_012088 [Paspalum notatum var. saurae]|uniref:F-box domain-containing protein n=1 Tax=Paspalum notatum var. saurae TaxID=547442 RepID=A0AAQ3SYB0_PASNO